MPVNYQNGKIYSIRSHQTDKIYIGSTTQRLNQRLTEHKHELSCKSKCLFNYETSPKIELLENYSCNTKLELRKREQEYLDIYEDIKLNHDRAVMTKQSRHKYICELRKRPDQQSKIKELQKKHNELAKVKVVCNKCNKTFSKSSMWRHKKIC